MATRPGTTVQDQVASRPGTTKTLPSKEDTVRILVASDHAEDVTALEALGAGSSCEVERAASAIEACDRVRHGACDCAVVDASLPGADRFSALRRLRDEGVLVPIVLISAKDDPRERAAGLDAGADDVVSRPYDGTELAARVRSAVRRGTQYAPSSLHAGDLSLDRATFTLSHEGRSERLGRKEFQIMELLMRHHDRCVPLSQLVGTVWGFDRTTDPSVVWTNVSYLRRRIAAVGSAARIVARRNQGYTLVTRS